MYYDFDGSYAIADKYINGKLSETNAARYSSFEVEEKDLDMEWNKMPVKMLTAKCTYAGFKTQFTNTFIGVQFEEKDGKGLFGIVYGDLKNVRLSEDEAKSIYCQAFGIETNLTQAPLGSPAPEGTPASTSNILGNWRVDNQGDDFIFNFNSGGSGTKTDMGKTQNMTWKIEEGFLTITDESGTEISYDARTVDNILCMKSGNTSTLFCGK